MKILFRLGAILVLAGGAASALAQEKAKPPVMKHEVKERENCASCHVEAKPDVPQTPAETHKGREGDTCLWCHAADAAMQTKTPRPISHELEDHEKCGMCHSRAMEDVPAMPADHKDRKDATCTMCHTPAA